jgi:hypothetical protein
MMPFKNTFEEAATIVANDTLFEEHRNDNEQQPYIYYKPFDNIIGFTFEEAATIVANDTWFKEHRDDNEQRYIDFETDETGLNVTSIVRRKVEDADKKIQVDKTFDVTNMKFDTEGKIAAFLFSVNGNKGPTLALKKFINAGGKVSGEDEKIFLGHCAWLEGNCGYGANKDALCMYEIEMSNNQVTLENIVPNLSSGREIFTTPLYAAFIEVRKALALYAEFIEVRKALGIEENRTTMKQVYTQIQKGMEQDKRLVERYLY